jgi:hypothetical protein
MPACGKHHPDGLSLRLEVYGTCRGDRISLAGHLAA